MCEYGAEELAFDPSSPRECILRAPLTYGTKFSPSVILEGEWSAAESVRKLSRSPSKSTSYVSFTAQRSATLFLTTTGWKWQEQALLAELNLVLDSVKAPEAAH